LDQSRLNLAVVYGCSDKQKLDIIRRLDATKLGYNHPILLAGMIAELERIRLNDQVEALLNGFALKAGSDQDLELDMTKEVTLTFLKSCFESRELLKQIKAARWQLKKMIARITQIENKTCRGMIGGTVSQAGQEIISRLQEIFIEYKDKIIDCEMVIDNMSMTMKTVRC
jgi:hypothetical protein